MAEPMLSSEGKKEQLRKKSSVDESAVQLVFERLGDSDPGVRREAVRLIARSPTSTALLLMLEKALCDDAELARRSSAMEALGAVGRPALSMLARLATDPRAAVRRLAVDAVGLAKVPEALEILDRCARDPQPAVRSAALEAVARTGSPRAAAVLLRVVEDRAEQGSVVLAALLGLQQLGKLPSIATLKRRAEDPLTAAPALRLLGRAGETDTLLAALKTHTGARQKAALLGLADALEKGRAPSQLKAPEVAMVLRSLVDEGDVTVACAALSASAHAGDVDVLAQAAARDDRAHLVSAAHRAAATLARQIPELPARLRVLAADDAPGADLLRELADAVERSTRGASITERPATRVLDDRTFARLVGIFERSAGLALAEDARVRVEARLLPRVDETGSIDFPGYADLLSSNNARGRDELSRALELVTVHETYLFRERTQLDAFVADIIPTLRGRDDVRVWSAGSSTGEEAYTLAILMHEHGVTKHEVIGTDLSPDVIEQARAGRYGPRSFRGEIASDVRRRWFVYELGGVRISPALKETVRFQVANLIDEAAAAALPTFDVIFCRNVLIYLTADARRRIIEMFFRKLKPGGVLMLGHSESLLHVESPFSLKPLSRGIAYQKPEASS
jgi:chemotaxis protein methyltransferase CheR